MSFAEKLAFGKVAEGFIANWLMARGNSVLPVYEIEKSTGKGPQLFGLDASLVAPDMVAFTENGVVWIEAKHKSVFTWHRNTQQWTTGIDLRHYGDYLKVAKTTRLPVWLMFFHNRAEPSDSDRRMGCPESCPTGLFGGDIFDLVPRENHRSPALNDNREGIKGHGNSGMVYWAASTLKQLASHDHVMQLAQQRTAIAA